MTTEALVVCGQDGNAVAGLGTSSIVLDGNVKSLPVRKRLKQEDVPDTTEEHESNKRIRLDESEMEAQEVSSDGGGDGSDGMKAIKRAPMSKAREVRLEQNRKAARESRRRKKVMIEELQRSVIFFSRANGTLKQQNEELSRMLIQAQAQIAAQEAGQTQQGKDGDQQTQQQAPPQQVIVQAPPQQVQVQSQDGDGQQDSSHETDRVQNHGQVQFQNLNQQAQAQIVATQAMYESQGFPPAAARAAAQTMSAAAGQAASSAAPAQAPAMQAVANFQHAAAFSSAMQAAMGITPAPAGTAQQAYNETLFVMQQAAAAAAAGQAQFALGIPMANTANAGGQLFPLHLANPMAWQNNSTVNAAAAPAVQPPQQTAERPT